MDDVGERDLVIYYICTGFSILIIFVTAFLILVYSKTKALHSYPCYFNIILSSVISMDNILRIIPFYDNDIRSHSQTKPKESFGCIFQGFTLALFDKFMLTTMTLHSTISFLGIVKLNFYKKNEKKIFISLTIISFVIPLVMAIVAIQNGVGVYDDVCYVKYTKDEDDDDKDIERKIKLFKTIPDLIVTSILFLINLYFILHLLIHICKLIIKCKERDEAQKVTNYYFHLWKFFVNLMLTIITFIMVILIITGNFLSSDETISLCYVILSLFIVLFYTLNYRVLKEGKNILCCIKEENNNENDENFDEGIEIGDIINENLIESTPDIL
jgi:hypothetical protein